jgi:hypothetical protein
VLVSNDFISLGITLANGYLASDIAERHQQWMTRMPRYAARWRSVILFAVVTSGVGLATEIHRPKLLPQAHIVPSTGKPLSGGFITSDGGQLYLAVDRRLVVLNGSAYQRFTVDAAKFRPESHQPSLGTRLLRAVGL